ncbi:MAG: O-antigen ligase family protein [Bacillota bacterium]|nr:O-antigen ligase family protein [Bacillota bacterium]
MSRARSNTARPLALFLAFSVLANGLYFPKEWIFFGFALSGYILLSYSYQRFKLDKGIVSPFGLTDALLMGMFFLSILGVLHPVKVKDGLIEALSWGTFWLVYRLGTHISRDETAKEYLVRSIGWLSIIVAIVGWLPWVSKVAGRLSSVFGYSNATAAFLGAALLLYSQSVPVKVFLGISLLSTGSRAGVGLFLVLFGGQQLLFWLRYHRTSPIVATRQRLLTGLGVILLGVAGIVFMLLYYRLALKNLTAWSFMSSSWQERLAYFKDGINLAWQARGYPRAGGWMAFPTVQHVPYWTADPHSSFIHVLLNQGIIGILCLGIWGCYLLGYLWRTRKRRSQVQVRVGGALLFLILHSLVDADFSFGSLGLLFWMLFGSFQFRDECPSPLLFKWNRFVVNLSSKGVLGLSLILCLACGSTLINPSLLEKEKSWNIQARYWSEQDPDKTRVLWDRSLNWDQTQIAARREQAESILKQGNIESGMKAVEEVLHWQPLDLEAYEWAQSVVWDAAEVQRKTQSKTAITLYRWIEGVPQKIREKVNNLSFTERLLWKNYSSFLPSEHIKLLADYARQRQLTQPPPRT